jgi:hypothetical protein
MSAGGPGRSGNAAGFAAVDAALYAVRAVAANAILPLALTPHLLDSLAPRKIVVFGADLWASDWNLMRADEERRLMLGWMKPTPALSCFMIPDGKTAAMLLAFLHSLKAQGYLIVHLAALAM